MERKAEPKPLRVSDNPRQPDAHRLRLLRDLSFQATLDLWPYKERGVPDDEIALLNRAHHMRLSEPGMTDAERQISLDYLKAQGLFEWISDYVKKEEPKAKAPASKKVKRKS